MKTIYQNPMSSIIKSQKRINFLISYLTKKEKKLKLFFILDIILLFLCFPGIIAWVPLVGYIFNVISTFLGDLLLPVDPSALSGVHGVIAGAFSYMVDSPLFMIIFNVIVWGIPVIYILFAVILWALKFYNKINSSTRTDIFQSRNDLLSKNEDSITEENLKRLQKCSEDNRLKPRNYLRIQKFIDDYEEAAYDRVIDLDQSPENSILDTASGRETKIYYEGSRVFIRRAPGNEIDLEINSPILLYRIGNENKAMVAFAVTWIR